jgi:hypothetical protein
MSSQTKTNRAVGVFWSLAALSAAAVAAPALLAVTTTVAQATSTSGVSPGLTAPAVAMAVDSATHGYWEVGMDGSVAAFDAPYYGSMGGTPLVEPVVGVAGTPTGGGYWEVASDGGIFAFGNATFKGSMGGHPLVEPVVAIATDRATGGYWEVASDGGLFAFGAPFLGSMGGHPLNEPVVGMVSTPTGAGYWEVASDGGIFAFGNATFKGSMGGSPLVRPIVAIASDPATGGYWEVASDGGIFAFGAPFFGSMGGKPLNAPISGMVATPTGGGYWEVGADGGIFAFGNATYAGAGSYTPPHPILPPQNPGANIAASPAFSFEPGVTTYDTGTSVPPCWALSGNSFVATPSTSQCLSNEMAAINNARAQEGLPPAALPSNFGALTPTEQLFVVTDIERVSRGEPAVVGLSSLLDSYAGPAAAAQRDPSFNFATIPSSTWWGGNVALGVVSPLAAHYTWMYDDGYGSTNSACSSPGAQGCWGHRDNILREAATLVMGAGYAPAGNGTASVTELFVAVTNPGNLPSMYYTWAQAVAAGAGA